MMQDSSPLAGHDWLMTRAKEIPRKYLAPCAQALVALIDQIRRFAYANCPDADDEDAHAGLGMSPEVAWRPNLAMLTHIKEHVYTPACISAGCRDVVHLNSATAWQVHLDIPNEVPLDIDLSNIVANTSDMGDEMSGPSFRVNTVSCDNDELVWFVCKYECLLLVMLLAVRRQCVSCVARLCLRW